MNDVAVPHVDAVVGEATARRQQVCSQRRFLFFEQESVIAAECADAL
jgi:hypothetical protein